MPETGPSAQGRAQQARELADVLVQDGPEHDILAWPGDLRGRNINWRMTPDYARRLAELLWWALHQRGQEDLASFDREATALWEAAGRLRDRPVRPPGTD